MSDRSATRIHSKVGAGAIGGAVSVITVWLLTSFGFTVPPEVAAAMTTLFTAVFGYVASP